MNREAEAEAEAPTLEEARRLVRELRERQRAQAAQLLAWRRRGRLQEEAAAKAARGRADQLSALSAQLLLLEARLARKQKDIGAVLAARETALQRQQRLIRALQARLAAAGLDASLPTGAGGGRAGADAGGEDEEDDVDDDEEDEDEEGCALDSLNDSDSAVVLEEALAGDPELSAGLLPRLRSAGLDPAVTVVRSVSDAVEPAAASKLASLRRCNGLLRRPEVLETVYSVEEDPDCDPALSPAPEHDPGGGRLQALYGSFERLSEPQPRREPPNPVTAYNRVMSNHRSVTKPKDVKYKRINKAKSKSLEELRGRLRCWVDKGGGGGGGGGGPAADRAPEQSLA